MEHLKSVRRPARMRRLLFVLPLLVSVLLAGAVIPAQAITRDEVLARATSWVDRQVRYSQTSYFEGYRQDCSGFVSMAWGAGTSFTTYSMSSYSQRISKDELQPGDAILTSPGHALLFAGWLNDSHSQYAAMEESTWGYPAQSTTKNWTFASVARRFNNIEEPAPVIQPVVAPVPEPVAAPPSSTPTEAAPIAVSGVRLIPVVASLPRSMSGNPTADLGPQTFS
ncbi:MAG: hypothetical protein HGA39_04600 [Coriobacteriia bacterium]|nr:hypothetical protein [Coriobacteriia bacterium]